jgi:hypothetical protein
MAIQQIGGRNVYVITGSGSTGGRTSTGQSWADLVTQQRYTLYDAAYKQALREYESGKLSNKELKRRHDQIQKELEGEKLRHSQNIKDIELRKLSDISQTQRANLTSANVAARGRAAKSEEEQIPGYDEYLDTLTDTILEKNNKILRARKNVEQIQDEVVKEKFKSDTEMYAFINSDDYKDLKAKGALDTTAQSLGLLAEQRQKAEKEIETLKSNPKYKDDRNKFDEYYKQQKNIKGSAVSEFKPKRLRSQEEKFDALIQQEQDAIDSIDTRLANLDFEEQDTIDVLERAGQLTREMESRPIRQPREPRERGRFRRAEMEALGESPEPDVPLQLSGAEPMGMTDTAVTEAPTIAEPVQATYGSLENKEIPIIDPNRTIDVLDKSQFGHPDKPPTHAREQLLDYRRTDPMAFPARGEMPSGERPRVERLGTLPQFEEVEEVEVTDSPQSSRRAIRKNIQNQFKQVRNLDDTEKTTVAIQLLEEYKDQFGVSSKEYNKYKKLILDELEKSQNPEEARAHRSAEQYIKKDPTAAANLLVPKEIGSSVHVTDSTQKLVQGIFGGPIQKFANDELDLAELDKLRKNAIEQVNKTPMAQGKKDALKLIDIMYWTVIEQSR